MADDLGKRRPQDPNFINVNEAWELAYWCKELGVTESQLKAAVKAVGTSVKKVKDYLGK